MKRIQNKYLIVVLFFFTMILSSCEKEIQLNTNDFSPKIVMNSIISSDSIIEVRVSKSFLYTDTARERSRLSDATLTLYINGKMQERMKQGDIKMTVDYDRLGFQYYAMVTLYRSTVRPKSGDVVRIEASADGFPPTWAETTLPLPLQIHEVDTVTFFTPKRIIDEVSHNYYPDYGNDYDYPEGVQQERLYRNMRIHLKVSTNPSDETQFLILRIKSKDDENAEYPRLYNYFLRLYTDNDPIFKETYRNSLLEDLLAGGFSYEGVRYFDSAIFSDKLFVNNRYTLDLSVTDYYPTFLPYEEPEELSEPSESVSPIYRPTRVEVLNPPMEIRLTNISSELYPLFRKGKYDPHSDEVLFEQISEPELTYSNVQNGIGVVGAVSTTTTEIRIPPFPGEGNIAPRK